jgi:hypothetical protein
MFASPDDAWIGRDYMKYSRSFEMCSLRQRPMFLSVYDLYQLHTLCNVEWGIVGYLQVTRGKASWNSTGTHFFHIVRCLVTVDGVLDCQLDLLGSNTQLHTITAESLRTL